MCVLDAWADFDGETGPRYVVRVYEHRLTPALLLLVHLAWLNRQ